MTTGMLRPIDFVVAHGKKLADAFRAGRTREQLLAAHTVPRTRTAEADIESLIAESSAFAETARAGASHDTFVTRLCEHPVENGNEQAVREAYRAQFQDSDMHLELIASWRQRREPPESIRRRATEKSRIMRSDYTADLIARLTRDPEPPNARRSRLALVDYCRTVRPPQALAHPIPHAVIGSVPEACEWRIPWLAHGPYSFLDMPLYVRDGWLSALTHEKPLTFSRAVQQFARWCYSSVERIHWERRLRQLVEKSGIPPTSIGLDIVLNCRERLISGFIYRFPSAHPETIRAIPPTQLLLIHQHQPELTTPDRWHLRRGIIYEDLALGMYQLWYYLPTSSMTTETVFRGIVDLVRDYLRKVYGADNELSATEEWNETTSLLLAFYPQLISLVMEEKFQLPAYREHILNYVPPGWDPATDLENDTYARSQLARERLARTTAYSQLLTGLTERVIDHLSI